MDPKQQFDSVIQTLSDKQILAGLVFFLLLVGSLGLGSYSYTQQSSSVKCLGCLALNPIIPDFEDWWVEYPSGHPNSGAAVSHPAWVKSDLDKYDAVFIFLWSDGCLGCEEQWEDMKDQGLVTGEEDGGSLAKYKGRVILYSLDARDNSRGTNSISVYDPKGAQHGTPTSVFLVKLATGEIGWFAVEGQMPAASVDAILNIAAHQNL